MNRTITAATRPQQALQSYLDALLQEAAVELEQSVSLDEFEAAVLEEQVRDARREEPRPVLTRPLAESRPQVLPTIELRLPEVVPPVVEEEPEVAIRVESSTPAAAAPSQDGRP